MIQLRYQSISNKQSTLFINMQHIEIIFYRQVKAFLWEHNLSSVLLPSILVAGWGRCERGASARATETAEAISLFCASSQRDSILQAQRREKYRLPPLLPDVKAATSHSHPETHGCYPKQQLHRWNHHFSSHLISFHYSPNYRIVTTAISDSLLKFCILGYSWTHLASYWTRDSATFVAVSKLQNYYCHFRQITKFIN